MYPGNIENIEISQGILQLQLDRLVTACVVCRKTSQEQGHCYFRKPFKEAQTHTLHLPLSAVKAQVANGYHRGLHGGLYTVTAGPEEDRMGWSARKRDRVDKITLAWVNDWDSEFAAKWSFSHRGLMIPILPLRTAAH